MPFGDNGGGDGFDVTLPPQHHKIEHYHGDSVRVLFFVGAIVLIVAKSTGADLPLSTLGAVTSAVVLVVLAGVTNPAQLWVHWLNAVLAVIGTLVFATSAVNHYREGISVFDPSFTYIEALALISLVALYFAVRTIRAFHLHSIPS
ncbi:MAG: hypothetical protein KGI71_03110 [Patescibacteria group bacterium]|nr:hypothetical protein [Patescibacteria group bacterium]